MFNTKINWRKDLPADVRRANALAAHGGYIPPTAQALRDLFNATTDNEAKRASKEDAEYFLNFFS